MGGVWTPLPTMVTYAWSNEILMESWSVRPFKFQWQKVKDKYLEPGFFSISPQRKSRLGMQRTKNIAIFAILGSLVNIRR